MTDVPHEITHDRLLRLERITHTRMKALDPARTFILATMSPLEVHGPHLPLGQDVFEARALAEHAALAVLERRPDWTVVLVPPMHVAADTLPMLGSVEFSPHLVERVAYTLLEPFAKAGFARMGFSSFHGGPRHFLALELAGERLARKYGVAVVSMFSMLLSRVREGHVFLDAIADVPGRRAELRHLVRDQHAGYVETSMALHLYGALVEDGWQALPGAVPREEPGEGENDSFLFSDDAGGGAFARRGRVKRTATLLLRALKFFRANSYYGYPAFASEEEGRRIFGHLVALTADAAGDFLDRGMDAGVHSPLWAWRRILLNRPLNAIADALMAT